MIPAQNPVGDIVPRHIAVIMDGNGRWAKRRLLPRAAGHRRGADAVRDVVTAAGELGVGYLTLYAFSSENWKRPQEEVNDLMGLLRRYLRRELAELHTRNVRFRVIGNRRRLSPDLVALIETAEDQTRTNTGLNLILAISYGGKDEIVEAARRLALLARDGKIDPQAIDGAAFEGQLATAGVPDPDLVIRTSGEKRLSNFLLWQTAYAEFVFTETLWPDFGRHDLLAAIEDYRGRCRRYGERKE